MKKYLLWILAWLLAGCGPAATTLPTGSQPDLLIMTHDSFSISVSVVEKFELDNQVSLKFLKSGDTGAALNRAILTKTTPMADVFFGVDNTVLSKAIQADIFEPYQSPLLASVGTDFQLDPEFHALPVDYGDVCINYDKAFFTQKGLAVPETLDELTQPEYKNMLVVQNPATSSPGLSFLLTTIASYGDPGYLEYWKALRENGVVVAGDWETAYYNHFSGSSGQGQQPMVVSYSSSPVAEVFFSSQPLDTAPTGAITAPGTCFRQIEFAGILKGSHNTDMAKKFIDYMLDVPFQEDMPLQMFVYPVNQGAELPEIFRDHSTIAEEPAVLPADAIDQNRELWITAWEGVVLH